MADTNGVMPRGSILPEVNASRQVVDILVVDDNPGKLLAIETALAPLGENIISANSGRDALRQLLARDFATIILDVNMPDMDGFETARLIRSRVRSATTPIIFVSAVNMDEVDAYHGYSLGAVDYIFAPVIPEVLRAKVAVFVELHRKSEEARVQAQRLQERTRELERSQRDLRLAERMASIGTLCAGLGHDMGNLLLPLSVWINSIKSSGLPPDLEDGVENLESCVGYLRRLASGLRLVSLDPSRGTGDDVITLSEWLDEVGPILRNTIPRGISLAFEIPLNLPPVCIAPHRLAQIAFNLIQNAGEVLRDRTDGVVRLWATRQGESEGVRFGVTDNGPGMSPEVLARCLDPFFTTKTRGISTGLGLSLVHGLVESAGSHLDIESSARQGTTFSFVLPQVKHAKAVDAAAIITISDPRLYGLALSFTRAAGCKPTPSVPSHHDGAAVWVTENAEDLAQRAEEFVCGHANRRVFLISDEELEIKNVCVSPLTGSQGLMVNLRRFLLQVGANTNL